MSVSKVREAIERLSAGMKVKIAGNAASQALRDIVARADAHSPVGCTLRGAPAYSLDVEVG